MTREADMNRVFREIAEPLREGDDLRVDDDALDSLIGAVSDEREVGGDDLDDEDKDRGGKLAFVAREEEEVKA